MSNRPPTYDELSYMVQVLVARVKELEGEISKLKHKKDSSNSSIPPGKDENRPKKNQSLRSKSGKSSGGQKGHKGKTLEMVANPDKIIRHVPCQCSQCGAGLEDIAETCHGRRQVVDIPPIQPRYIEHQVFSRQCTCGHINQGVFPAGIENHIQYGPNIESLVAYLNVGQYLPYGRMQMLLNKLFNIPVSQGSIQNMLERFSRRVTPMYEQIKNELEQGTLVGGDETGVKVNGQKWWFWTWQNARNTFITASDNRAYRTIEKYFPKGFKNAHLVSDCYAAHLKTPALSHQLCTSHLIRDLNYLIETDQSFRAVRMKLLLIDALQLKQKIPDGEFNQPNIERTFIDKELKRLLSSDIKEEPKAVKTFFQRIRKNSKYILEFLYHAHVPPDNNGSERAIRNAKVKQKISTQFKSSSGILNYAIIRSVFDTCSKRGIGIFETSRLVMSVRAGE
jgi:transposase